MAGQSVFKLLNIVGSNKYLLNARYNPQNVYILNLSINNRLFILRLPHLRYLPAVGVKQDTKNLLKSLNIPEKPKKPMTPYFRFVRDNRDSILKKNPEYKLTDIAKKCAEQWKTVDANVKQKYEQEFKNELEVYSKKVMEYQASLSDNQREALKLANEEKRKDKKKRLQKQFYKETNKPKRPMGAYMIFSMEQSKKLNKSPLEASKQIKELWDKLTDSEKEKYKHQYQKGKQQYDIEMAQWEAKMIEQGHPEVVRSSSQLFEKPSLIQTRKSKKPE